MDDLNRPEEISNEIDIRYLPRYNVTEAAFYLRLPVSTLRAWTSGQKNFKPLIVPVKQGPPLLSFMNLIEAYALASIRRKYRISMSKVRKAIDFVSRKFPSDNLLAEKNFETDGISLFLTEAGVIYEVSGEGQTALGLIKQYLQRIERDTHGLPVNCTRSHGRATRGSLS